MPDALFTIPGIALAGGGAAAELGGGIIGAIGAENAGSAAAAGYLAEGKAQADAYTANANIQGANAAQARFATERQTQDLQYNANRLLGRQQALYGAAGVTGAGNPFDVMEDTEAQVHREALNLFYTGDAAATQAGNQYNFDIQAASAAVAAANARAKAARATADTNATSSILSGIGNAVSMAAKFNL